MAIYRIFIFGDIYVYIYGCSEYCCRVNHPFHCGGTKDAISLCSARNPGKKYTFPIQGSYFVDGLKPTDCVFAVHPDVSIYPP